MTVQARLHEGILKNSDKVCEWFQNYVKNLDYPIYSSYDIRDAGFKVSNVDANIFPAGFNNICPADKETSADLMNNFINDHYGKACKKILLITEEHTQNPFYWDNVKTIQSLLESAHTSDRREVRVAIPRDLAEPLKVISATGHEFTVQSASHHSTFLKEFNPDLIISNNDFSEAYEEWGQTLTYPMNPPRELGWYQRKKSRYFFHYNRLAAEFSELIGLDPFLIQVKTEEFQNFDIASETSRQELAKRVDVMIANLKEDYAKRGITEKPFVFVKNNSGTYGLAVIKVDSGADVLNWSYKSRKKMKAAKGGRDVEEVIIQEGIPSIVKAETASAEPVIYMIGCQLAGGFLRTHSEKSGTESLNSPGAVYKRLCVSDLEVKPQGCPQENVYGWSAKLGMLAIAEEAREMNVVFKNFIKTKCDQ